MGEVKYPLICFPILLPNPISSKTYTMTNMEGFTNV